jgi:bifunctional oligoribonuclease and PAP phosphatase NrnA
MNELKSPLIAKIVASVRERQKFLIATHVRPDGDAVGSLLSLTFMLRKLGKNADPFVEGAVPPGCEFLPGVDLISYENPDPSQYDAAILVDCGDFQRVGSPLAEIIQQIPFIIGIDHHASHVPFGNISWVEPTASSTCEMLYDLCQGLQLSLDPDIATQIYTGILTDTGSFRFSNTNQRVLKIAADLVSSGARPDHIAEEVYDSASPQRLLLLSRALSTVEFHADHRMATAELSLEMFSETGSTPMDSEGFINHLRSVKSVQIAIVFREDTDGLVYISMRSKGGVDVAGLATRFGGGGHHRAAACRMSGDLKQIRAEFTKNALDYFS